MLFFLPQFQLKCGMQQEVSTMVFHCFCGSLKMYGTFFTYVTLQDIVAFPIHQRLKIIFSIS